MRSEIDGAEHVVAPGRLGASRRWYPEIGRWQRIAAIETRVTPASSRSCWR